jgi:hypothetical protein
VSSGPKDVFNFFHSQLRINIGCAFGELEHPWSILRKPIPMNISIKKICYLVYILCKLHNYCISNRDAIYSHIESDSSYVVMVGGLFLPRMKNHREAFGNTTCLVLIVCVHCWTAESTQMTTHPTNAAIRQGNIQTRICLAT